MNGRPGTLPIAASQEMMWEFMTALSPGDPGLSRLVVMEFRRLRGTLDEAAFGVALADVVQRHEALRVVFTVVGEDPLMRVLPAIDTPLSVVDLSDVPADQQWQRLEHLAHDWRNAPFDLLRGPLWRLGLVRLGGAEHVLVLTCFHMISDGWSCRVFVEDLVRAYQARLGGCTSPAEPLVGFSEIVEMQRRELTGRPERAAHWRSVFPPLPNYLPFEPRAIGPDDDLTAEVEYRFSFPPGTGRRLRQVAWRVRTTAYVALMAAYHALLAARTGTERVVLGTTTLGRETPGSRSLIGQFTNNVYVPARVSPDTSMLELIAGVDRAMATAVDNVLSFRSIAEIARPGRGGRRPWPDNHLFTGWFQAAAPASPDLVHPDLTVEQIWVTSRARPGAPPVLPAARVPAARLPVWAKRGAPIVVIDDDRSGGAMIANRTFYGEDLVHGLIADYTRIVAVLLDDPTRTVASLAPCGVSPR